jgi:hypothetical protein
MASLLALRTVMGLLTVPLALILLNMALEGSGAM